MRSKLFSPLIRGTGPEWSTNIQWYEDEPGKMPLVGDPTLHSRYIIHDRNLYRTVPKTFTTNKGSLVLYTSEDHVLKEKVSQTVHPNTPQDKEYQSTDLHNLQRNILFFGAGGEDKACLKFTKPSQNDVYLDDATRPGALPEVYLEDLKYKTKQLMKTNRLAVARLRPTERPKQSRPSSVSPAPSSLPPEPLPTSPLPSSRPDSGTQKRRLLRPPSAPPQLMPSVEKRKIEIIRDQMKHLDAASRREKMKFADFEFVSAIPEHLQVKGIGGKSPKRRAYSSPVYKTQYCQDKAYVTSDQSKSLPLFVVTSGPSRGFPGPEHAVKRGSQDYGSSCGGESVDSDRLDLTESLHQNHEYEQYQDMTKSDIIAAEVKSRKREDQEVVTPDTGEESQMLPGSDLIDLTENHINTPLEVPERCPSSRQIIIDLPDENKEQPKESFISEELREVKENEKLAAEVNLPDDEATTTTSTMDHKNGEEISSTLDDSLQNVTQHKILTYPSFLSLSSANSKGDTVAGSDLQQQGSDVSIDGKREALQSAKELIGEIANKKSRKKRGGKEDSKKRGVRSAKSKKQQQQQQQQPAPDPSPTATSDGEYREKPPPKSLVAMHKDNIDSTVSITKKKSSSSGSRKWRGNKEKVAWDTGPHPDTSEPEDHVFSPVPQTMLLDSDAEDQVRPERQRQRKKLERRGGQRLEQPSLDKPALSPSASPETPKRAEPVLSRTVMGLEGEVDEELEERMRQEEREREQKTLELLERRIGVDDGSLKRLGEKVETIEKETIQQKDKEAALRQQEKEDELARKEEERRAYEEVMRAQEAEYERHLQNMLRQEEERNKQYLDKLRKEEIQRDIKRKFAIFRQNQNLELRQHVRLMKMKHKFTAPFKYSYFPILKVNHMKIVLCPDQEPNQRKSSGGSNKPSKKKKMALKRV